MLSTSTAPSTRDLAALEVENEQLRYEIKRLKELAYLDGLTGIANRRSFDELLSDEWNRSARNQSLLSLLLIDLDFFKKYNDDHGHQGGDELLQDFAKALRAVPMRSFDLVARYGGEEFAVVLPDSSIHGAVRVAESIRETAHCCGITVSIGVACVLPDPDDKPSSLIALADAALYRAKDGGRDRVEVG